MVVLSSALALIGCSNSVSSTSSSTTRRSPSATSPHLTPIPQSPGPVPTQYQAQYARIQAEVGAFASQVGTPPRHPATTVGTELLAANGNIGSRLLNSSAINGVATELDVFSALGVEGVTVDVSFPLLLPTTSRSSGYLSFYERVAELVRAHHMVLSVEENPIFSGTPLTSLSISYAGLTVDTYAAEQHAQAQLIIDNLHPKYLTLLDETDTFSATLGVDLNTPAASVQVVNDELRGLNRDDTLVGAGTGTWTTPAIDQALVTHTSIDYLSVHVYPLGQVQVANLNTDVAAAKSAHKRLVMDETWLEKPTAQEAAGAGPQGAPEELKIKSYSFWEPLDVNYLSAMVSYVRTREFDYVSFFDGARAFFGYLTWSPQLEASSYPAFSLEYNQLVAHNMRSLSVSRTGLELQRAINGT
jgi:hypothetical protein